jgi:hypothetical protein
VAKALLQKVVGEEGGLGLAHAHGGLHQDQDGLLGASQNLGKRGLKRVRWKRKKLLEVPPCGKVEGPPAKPLQGLGGEVLGLAVVIWGKRVPSVREKTGVRGHPVGEGGQGHDPKDSFGTHLFHPGEDDP